MKATTQRGDENVPTGAKDGNDEIASLRFELHRLRTMMNHSPVGIFHDDGQNNCIYVNDAWCAITGLTHDEALGTGWFRVFHPDDIPWLKEKFNAARSTTTPFSGDYRIVRPGGVVRWVHGQSVPIIDSDEKLLGYAGTLHDITDRVEMRKYLEDEVARRIVELRKADESLRIFGALFEHALVAILIATPSGKVTHVNPAYQALLGDADAAIGSQLVDAMRPVDEDSRTALATLFRNGDAGRCNVAVRGSAGALIPAQVDYHVIREGVEHVIGLAVMVRDLTAERRAEAERLELEAHLAASREALIRELSTPLMPVARGVIVMPIVGSINDERAQQIREVLLDGIQRHDAFVAILDITGVKLADATAASALVSLARAAKLLGTRLVLSGIGPNVARMIVELGVEIEDMITTSTLATALTHAFVERPGFQRKR